MTENIGDLGDRAAVWLHRSKNELAAAAAVITGIMLATGYLLTWARIASEELPSQAILTALPRTYFVTTGVESMLSPLVIAIVFASIWLRCEMWLSGRGRRMDLVVGWAGFGMLLGLVSATVATWVNKAEFQPPGVRLLAPAAVFSALVAAGVGAHLGPTRPAADRSAPGVSTGGRRTVLAATLILCFALPCSIRIMDARFIGNGLPFTQAVVDGPCTPLTNGIPTTTLATGRADPTAPCQVGGFYLGANSDWIFLAQRRHPCPKDPPSLPPQLVMFPRGAAHVLVARDTPPPRPPGCKTPT